MIRTLIKRAFSYVLIPAVKWYLRKPRNVNYRGTTIKVFPGIFHPGLFYSTKFLARYLQGKSLAGKSFLELGCGTGMISILASRSGANVSASDISPLAVENTKQNALENNVALTLIQSDLFDSIQGKFDIIVINPPYYARPVATDLDLPWHCGENFEYFEKLFHQIGHYVTKNAEVIMVLTEGCDIVRIKMIAQKNGIVLNQVAERKVLFDRRDFILRLDFTPSE